MGGKKERQCKRFIHEFLLPDKAGPRAHLGGSSCVECGLQDGPFLGGGKLRLGICLTSVIGNTMNISGRLSCAYGTRIWGLGSLIPVPPPPPRALSGDVFCHCCVLTVPDTVQGRLLGWLARQAQAARACQRLPFLETHAGVSAGLQGQISCLKGAALCLCHGPAEGKEGKARHVHSRAG
jgi:hypothetical protein